MAQEAPTQNQDLSNTRKTLYCIRHAQSEYNAAVRNPKTWLNTDFWRNWFDPKIRDPLLSTTGKQQVASVASTLDSCRFLSTFDIGLVVTSPLQRATDTMFGILQPQMGDIRARHIPMMAHPLLREWTDSLGDV